MKIIFICGSLEPGRDGVGDYTRKLASEIIREGHKAAIVSLAEENKLDLFEGVQHCEEIKIPVLRSAVISHKNYVQEVKTWIDEFNPGWISLQFVPFSFHQKGLVFRLHKLLLDIGNGRKWHIMVHELWVGMHKSPTKKTIAWGWVQKQLIKYFFRQINPAIIHTHTQLYLLQLKKIGFNAFHLPLFGNISMSTKIEKAINSQNKKDMGIVLFGGIHPGAPIDQFAKDAALYSRKKKIPVSLTLVGRCGSEQERWASTWTNEGLNIKIMGEQSAESVSEILRCNDLGISTTPIALIEKSGSVAAMREHGLPVLCLANFWKPGELNEFNHPEGVAQYVPGMPNVFEKLPNRFQAQTNASNIALQFINALSAG